MKPGSNFRVLLIGGSGFLGQHLVRSCANSNIFVRVLGRNPSVAATPEQGVEYLQGDYENEQTLNAILEDINVVVHLAHDSVHLADFDAHAEFDRNIRPSIKLMDACLAHKISKLLFVSSGGTVYGNHAQQTPIVEDTRANPISLYGTSKLTVEHLGNLYHAQKNLPFIVARPTNAYGPGQRPFRGQGFIATAFASALEGKKLNIFGDGAIIRDYIHASDVADALLSLIIHGKTGEAYNIGSGIGISLRQLLEQYICPISREDGIELRYEYGAPRGVDVNYNVVDNTKILRDTGFQPAIPLAKGLQETWSWLKKATYK